MNGINRYVSGLVFFCALPTNGLVADEVRDRVSDPRSHERYEKRIHYETTYLGRQKREDWYVVWVDHNVTDSIPFQQQIKGTTLTSSQREKLLTGLGRSIVRMGIFKDSHQQDVAYLGKDSRAFIQDMDLSQLKNREQDIKNSIWDKNRTETIYLGEHYFLPMTKEGKIPVMGFEHYSINVNLVYKDYREFLDQSRWGRWKKTIYIPTTVTALDLSRRFKELGFPQTTREHLESELPKVVSENHKKTKEGEEVRAYESGLETSSAPTPFPTESSGFLMDK